jgi:hypothetical protein
VPDFVTPHGSTFTWGTTTFYLTSLQVNAQSGGEIDITSMSSEVVADSANTKHKLIVPDYDTSYSARYGTDIQIEFFAGADLTTSNYFDCIGSKRLLTLKIPQSVDATASPGLQILARTAAMTQMSLTGGVGEYVKGSATFKISGL